MNFEPTADRLLPELDIHTEMVLLARTLWREGYDDHLAGHITVNQGDGTLLCKPVWTVEVDRGCRAAVPPKSEPPPAKFVILPPGLTLRTRLFRPSAI